MSEFPLNIPEKEDYPDKVNALSEIDSKYYESAEEKNKKTRALTELNQRLTTEEQKDFTGGVYSVQNLADLPATGESNKSYKVTNDSLQNSNNGFYTWNGSNYVKDAELVENVVQESNTSIGVSGEAVYKEIVKTRNHAKEIIYNYNPNLNFVDVITILASVPSSPSQNDCYYVYNANNNTIFTGVTASTGQLIVYNNSAWEVHDIIPIKNKHLFLNPNKIQFGDFSYVSTTRDFENYIANSIVSFTANKLPDNILLKIGWFRRDASTIRFTLFESDDNGVTYTTNPNLDLSYKTDGYTIKLLNYLDYEIDLILDLREIQALPSFHYYVVPNINTEGNLVFNNDALKIKEKPFKGLTKIISDYDVERLNGTITGGSDFTTNKTTFPLYLYRNGTINLKIKLKEDIFSKDNLQTIMSFVNDRGNECKLQISPEFARANELWNQRMDSFLYFKDNSSSQEFIQRLGGGLIANSYAYNLNQGTLFAVRYIGATPATDIDLRITKNNTTLFFHDGDAGSETNTRATFTLASYTTVKDLLDAIEADVWCAANIEILYKSALSETTDRLTYVNATKLVSQEVRVDDRTVKRVTSKPSGTQDEWVQAYESNPVYIEKNTINRVFDFTLTWKENVMECLIDGKRMRVQSGTYTPFYRDFPTEIILNDTSLPFNGEILSFEYKPVFTKPTGNFIPIEAHQLNHDYDETAAANNPGNLAMSLQRLTDLGSIAKEKQLPCLTVKEHMWYKLQGIVPPFNYILLIVDDYRDNWFKTLSSRNLMDALGLKPSFNLIGSNLNFVTDRDFWRSVINHGWDVHTHCKWHTEIEFLSYDNIKLWIEDAKQVFDDNFLSNQAITIPFSTQKIRDIRMLKHNGFPVVFTGADTNYSELNEIPHINDNAHIRLICDSEIPLSTIKATFDLFDIWE